MRHEFVGDWSWLRPYTRIAAWLGWILLISGTVDLVGLYVFSKKAGASVESQFLAHFSVASVWYIVRSQWVPGLLSLWTAEMLFWVSNRDRGAGLLQRQGPRLLLVAAFVYLIQFGLTISRIPNAVQMLEGANFALLNAVLGVTQSLSLRAAPVVILIGLSQLLARITPALEESRHTI